jgi:hypothetical protein
MDVRFRDYYAYERDVQLEDITSCENNAAVLNWLRSGSFVWGAAWEDILCITEMYDSTEGDKVAQFIVREGDDLGWLGYFIGRNKHLRILNC